ncbi:MULTISPECIES: hypothetical protein [unclassified Thioalkalivibrio]|uniref:hypothetical protein n=1 Tax=unclassified Thioalkalivibrio TaxID=2621013 RepID=UPI000462ABEC|nr:MULTISPECIES: hypothetical protein [unclassified Thioalkalivibrio]
MARIRTIKPEFWQDEDLAACSPHARLLAIALLQLCDKNGVFRAIPMQIHAHAFPWESEVNIPSLLEELEGCGYVILYRVDGKSYGHIPGFTKHQRIQGKEATADGQYPAPDQADTHEEKPSIPGEYGGDSRGDTGKGRGKGKGTGEKEQGTGAQGASGSGEPRLVHSTSDRFEEFWQQYPKKKGKKPAKEAWTRKRLDGRADEIIADVQLRAGTDSGWRQGFIPNPLTYLNQERWQDEIQRDGPQGQPKVASNQEAVDSFVQWAKGRAE